MTSTHLTISLSKLLWVTGPNLTSVSITYEEIPYHNTPLGIYTKGHNEFTSIYQTAGSMGYNIATGKGDICRYISDKGWVSGKWHIPTAEETERFFSTGTAGLAYPNRYGLASPGYTVTNIYPLSNNGTDVISNCYYIGPGVINAGSTTVTDNMIISLPASGYRFYGNFSNMGTSGYYSTSTPRTINGASAISYDGEKGGIVLSGHNLTTAYPIRCVRDE